MRRQVPQAKGPFEIVEREIPEPTPGSVLLSKYKPVEFAIATLLPKRGFFQAFSTRGASGARSHRDRGVRWLEAFDGNLDSAWELVGMEVTAGIVIRVAVEIFSPARHPPWCWVLFFDGGYADYMVAPAEAIAAVPEELSAGGCTFDVCRHHHVQLPSQ